MKKNYIALLFLFLSASISETVLAQNCVDLTIQVTTTVQTNPPSITFSWATITGATSIKLFRKTKIANSWGVAIATLAGNATTYTDNTVAVGSDYEYKINSTGALTANTYIYAGIKFPQIENRRKVILLVDNTFSVTLASELKRLESDMIGDGWQVIRHDVMRNDIPPNIKALITADYNADPQNVKCVYVFGHVPVPYSGDLAPDGHVPDHQGAWPADGYYADMTGTWTDVSVNNVAANRPENKNAVGDGKFDQNFVPTSVQLQIGRVDLSNMPAFPGTEEQLLRQYLNKDHDFRFKVVNAQRKGLIDDNFGYFGGEAFASSGWRNFTSMFPPSDISSGNIFADDINQSYLWSYGCGGGSYTSCGGVGGTTDYVNNAPKSVFNMLFGSYFGDWDSQDNFLRAPLASAGWGLTNSWSGRPYSIYHHMALGENMGYAAWSTMRNNGALYVFNYASGFVTIGFMGDPTLRMHTVAPPTNVVATTNFPRINLNWTASADNVLGYCVYREDTATGVYSRVNNAIITGTSYVDSFPNNKGNYYMVRSILLESSNSGTYYNLSQGAFDTTVINVTGITEAYQYDNRFKMYPNPANENANVEFYLAAESQVTISLFDLAGREVMAILNNNIAQGNHIVNLNADKLAAGVYTCRFTVNNKSEYTKFVVSK
jgi:hypothetical protein